MKKGVMMFKLQKLIQKTMIVMAIGFLGINVGVEPVSAQPVQVAVSAKKQTSTDLKSMIDQVQNLGQPVAQATPTTQQSPTKAIRMAHTPTKATSNLARTAVAEPVYNSVKYVTPGANPRFRLTGHSTWNQESKSCDVTLNWSDLADPAVADSLESDGRLHLNGGYKVNSALQGAKTWTIEPINYGRHLKVLNVYPDDGKHNGRFLKSWLTGYDKNPDPASNHESLLDVTEISLPNFNSDPNYYLYANHSSGMYQYDAIYFGSRDSNLHQDISDSAGQAVVKFGNAGRAVIIGHDVVAGNHSIGQHTNFNKYLADKLGIQVIQVPDGQVQPRVGSQQVKFVHTGYLTEYPNELPTDRDYTISNSHTFGQYFLKSGQAERWMQFDQPYSDAENSHPFAINSANNLYELAVGQNPAPSDLGDNNHYLITKNNYAMIQTGHTTGACTPDEARIIVNTIYYVSSLATTNSATIKTAQDKAAPNTPDVYATKPTDPDKIHITLDKHVAYNQTYDTQDGDKGSTYCFKIQADTAGYSNEVESDAIDQKVESGVWGYLYKIDDQSSETLTPRRDAYGNVTLTDVDRSDGSGEHLVPNINDLNVGFDAYRGQGRSKFLHVATVDRAGNVSKTVDVAFGDYYNVPYQGQLTQATQGVGQTSYNTTTTFQPGDLINFKMDYQMDDKSYASQNLTSPITFSDHLPKGLTYRSDSLKVSLTTPSGTKYTLTPSVADAAQPLDFSVNSPSGTIFPPGSLIEITFQAQTSAQDNFINFVNHSELSGTSSDGTKQLSEANVTLMRTGVLAIKEVPTEIKFDKIRIPKDSGTNASTVGNLKIQHFSPDSTNKDVAATGSQNFNVQVSFNQALTGKNKKVTKNWSLDLKTDQDWLPVEAGTKLGQKTEFTGNTTTNGIVDLTNKVGKGQWKLTVPKVRPQNDNYSGTITWTAVNGLS